MPHLIVLNGKGKKTNITSLLGISDRIYDTVCIQFSKTETCNTGTKNLSELK